MNHLYMYVVLLELHVMKLYFSSLLVFQSPCQEFEPLGYVPLDVCHCLPMLNRTLLCLSIMPILYP